MCYNACDKWKPIVSSQGYNHASVKDFELFTTFCYLLSGGTGQCREATKGEFDRKYSFITRLSFSPPGDKV